MPQAPDPVRPTPIDHGLPTPGSDPSRPAEALPIPFWRPAASPTRAASPAARRQQSHRFLRFLVSAAFLLTVLVSRIVTFSIREGWLPESSNTEVGGVHIHHFVWGILLLVVTGYVAITYQLPRVRRFLAFGFGIGLGLTVDEFAIWLDLKDVYWQPRGEWSYYAIAAVALLLIIDTVPFFRGLRREDGGGEGERRRGRGAGGGRRSG